jgi:hypothetical protein
MPARYSKTRRSDDKGPEPEGLTLGQAYGRTLGFIGLERMGGVLMVDLAARDRRQRGQRDDVDLRARRRVTSGAA